MGEGGGGGRWGRGKVGWKMGGGGGGVKGGGKMGRRGRGSRKGRGEEKGGGGRRRDEEGAKRVTETGKMRNK